MTVPMYLLLGAAICACVRAMFGLAGLRDECKKRAQLDELWADEPDQVGADGAFTPPLGLTAATTTVGADASRREWPIASTHRSRPYDQLNHLIDEVTP